MNEAFPIVAGIIIGLVGGTIRRRWYTTAGLAALGVVAGTMAASVSGELEVSWGFLVWDVGQVLVVALVSARLVMLRSRLGATERPQPRS